MLGKFISNLLFCGIFAASAFHHFVSFEDDVPKLIDAGIPADYAPICLGIAIGLLIVGTILVITMQFEIFGYIAYTGFLIPVTWFMHVVPIIAAQAVPQDPNSAKIAQDHIINTLKNVCIIR
eukprot:310989_1